MLFVAYLILCVITGLLARNTRIGFWGFFLLSIILTPLVALAIVIVSSSRPPRRLPKTEG